MHYYSKLTFFITSIILLASCSKKINIKLPDEPVKPVLSAFIVQDSTIWATATLSGRYNYYDYDAGTNQPEHAVVKLYEDNNYIETLSDTTIYGKKYFRSKMKAGGNKEYKLTLEIDGYEMAQGSDRVPLRNELSISNKSMLLVPNKYDFFDFNFNFLVTNNGTTPRYYKFRMNVISHIFSGIDDSGDSIFYRNENIVELKSKSASLSIFSDDYIGTELGGVYAIEPLLPGEQKSYALEVNDYSEFSGFGNSEADSFILEATVLTDDAYHYLYSYSNVTKNDGDPTAEKQNVICNIKNGYGIVGGEAIQHVVFRRE